MNKFLTLLLVIPLFANDVEFESLYNQLRYKNIYLQAQSKDTKEAVDYDKIIFNTVGKVSYEDTSFNYDMDIYNFSRVPKPHRSISLSYDEEQKSGYQLNSLYIQQDIDKFSTYIGVLPFRGGRFSEMKDPTSNGGNGIPVIASQNLMCIFETYRQGDNTFIAGLAKIDDRTNFKGLEKSNKDTEGHFFILKNEDTKHVLELDVFDIYVKMRGIDYSRLHLLGLGYLYDDSIDSGISAYINLGYSNNKENIEEYVASQGIDNATRDYLGSLGYTVTNQNNSGEALLLGAKYETTVYNKDAFFGGEFFHTKGGYISMNHGTLFLSDHSWWQNRDGNEYLLFSGIEFNDNLTLLAQYSWGVSDKVATGFSVTNLTSDTSGIYGFDSFQKFQKFQLTLNYRF